MKKVLEMHWFGRREPIVGDVIWGDPDLVQMVEEDDDGNIIKKTPHEAVWPEYRRVAEVIGDSFDHEADHTINRCLRMAMRPDITLLDPCPDPDFSDQWTTAFRPVVNIDGKVVQGWAVYGTPDYLQSTARAAAGDDGPMHENVWQIVACKFDGLDEDAEEAIAAAIEDDLATLHRERLLTTEEADAVAWED